MLRWCLGCFESIKRTEGPGSSVNAPAVDYASTPLANPTHDKRGDTKASSGIVGAAAKR